MRIPEPILTIGVSIVAIGIAAGLYSYTRAPGATGSENATAEVSSWQYAEAIDPMTDARTVSASRDYVTANRIVEASVKCVNGQRLSYEFSTFDAERKGVRMISQPDAYSGKMMTEGPLPAGPFIRFQARVDDEPAKRGFVVNPAYVNELSIGPKASGINSEEMAHGSRLLIRLPTQGSEETVEIVQTDSAVNKVLKACGFWQDPAASGDGKDEAIFDPIPTTRATIPQALIDMKAVSDGGTAAILSSQDLSTVGTSVDTHWLGEALSKDDAGISVGLQLVQPQIWYYAIVHHSCKSPTNYRWEKFWTAWPDDIEGEMAVGQNATRTAKQESADDLGPLIFAKLCGSRASL